MPIARAIPGTMCTITADGVSLTLQCLDFATNREAPAETGRTLGGTFAKLSPLTVSGTGTVLYDDTTGGVNEKLHNLFSQRTKFTMVVKVAGSTSTFQDVILTSLSDTVTAEDNTQTAFGWSGLTIDTATWAPVVP